MSKDKMELDRIAFIGRTFAEYRDIFGLDEGLLRRGPILDCPAGAASFAAEANARGYNVTACDILYDLPVEKLLEKGERDIMHIYEKVAEAANLYKWDYHKDRDHLVSFRERALKIFSPDFEEGIRQGRYVRAELPHLPFKDGSFSLVLSSHFLFLYGDFHGLDFHLSAIMELLRVSSREVRIYPLNGLDAKPYPYMDEVLRFLARQGVEAEISETSFEFQKGANKMLRLRKETK